MSVILNVGLLTVAEAGDKVVKSLEISNLRASLQNFTWQHYTVFSLILLICTVVGYYVSFVKSVSSEKDYLVGGKNMQTLPVALSLIASSFNGIILLDVPTETYVYGIHYIYIISGILLMGLIFERIFLPVFYSLNVTSTFEYLEMRFDRRTRCFFSVLFAAETVVWLPIVIYIPALALNQVTGININVITPVVSIVCIIYTCIGGLKAIIWTDVMYTIIMLTAMILMVVKGTSDVSGYTTVWIRNWESGRLEGPNFNLNPLSRHSFWALLIGSFVVWLQTGAVNQTMMQRYLSLPDFASARRALWTFIIGIIFFQSLCAYAGLLIYATYYKCDPLTTNLVKGKNQLLPLLAMNALGNVPGLPGVFVAGIFSAALSTLSTRLNSMAAIILEDFYKCYMGTALSNYGTQILMKTTVIIFGTICVAMIFVLNKSDSISEIFMIVSSVLNGTFLGTFTMGVLLPWTTGIGAIIGGICSFCVMTWLHIGMQNSKAWRNDYFPAKKVSVNGCDYQFTPQESPYAVLHGNSTLNPNNTFMLYGISYLWYTSLGALITITVGLLISFIFKRNDPRDVDPTLLAPFIRKLIKPRLFPNQPDGNEIIYAYERKYAKVVVPRNEAVLHDDNGYQFT